MYALVPMRFLLHLFMSSSYLPVVGISHHAHLALHGSNLLLRGRLRSTHSEEVHFGGVVVVWIRER